MTACSWGLSVASTSSPSFFGIQNLGQHRLAVNLVEHELAVRVLIMTAQRGDHPQEDAGPVLADEFQGLARLHHHGDLAGSHFLPAGDERETDLRADPLGGLSGRHGAAQLERDRERRESEKNTSAHGTSILTI